MHLALKSSALSPVLHHLSPVLHHLSPVSTGQVDGPGTLVHFLTPELTGVKKCTRVHGRSTRPMNSGSGNRALLLMCSYVFAVADITVDIGSDGGCLGMDEGKVLSISSHFWLRVCRQRSHRLFPDVSDISVNLAAQQDVVSQDRRESGLHALVSYVPTHADSR